MANKEKKDIPITYDPQFEIQSSLDTEFIEALNKEMQLDVSEYFFVGTRKQSWYRTLSPMFDYVCGAGLPIGKWVEIYGENDTGKTTLTTIVVAGISLQKKRVLYIDMEGKLDKDYLQSFGADMDYISVMIAPTGEHMLNIVMSVLSLPYELQPVAIVIDSLASMPTVEETEKDIQGRGYSGAAMLWTRFTKMVTYDLAKSNTCLIGINQMRDIIGGGWRPPNAPTKKAAGPNAIQHKPALRIETKGVHRFDDGIVVSYKATKSHISKLRETSSTSETSTLKFGTSIQYEPYPHIDRSHELVELANRYGLFTKRDGTPAANFNSISCFDGVELGQYRHNVIQYLDDNAEFREEVLAPAVYKAMEEDRLTKKMIDSYYETIEENEVFVDIELDVEVQL